MSEKNAQRAYAVQYTAAADRFAPLMSEALQMAGPDAASIPLRDIQTRLITLAEKERALPRVQEAGPHLNISDDDCATARMRLAAYAWADEQLFHAARPDAGAWAALSLQHYYFHTASAGQLFFEQLHDELDACNVPRQRDNAMLPLSMRMELAEHAFRGRPCPEALAVFARCLLYGFRGSLYNKPEELENLRLCSLHLLEEAQQPLPEAQPPAAARSMAWLVTPLLCLLVPLLGTVLFGLFCAGIVADIPIPSF